MDEQFNKWNTLKKKLAVSNSRLHAKERQIWWCSLGINIGSELNGKHENFERPVLIKQFINKEMLLILPLTGKPHSDRHHVTVTNTQGLPITIILSQLRVVSPKRLLRHIGQISEEMKVVVDEKFKEYFCEKTKAPQ